MDLANCQYLWENNAGIPGYDGGMKRFLLLFLVICFFGPGPRVFAHDGPDPVLHYDFQTRFATDGQLVAQRGPNVRLPERVLAAKVADLGVLAFSGAGKSSVADGNARSLVGKELPVRDFTIEAWFSIDTPRPYGGILCALEDNGSAEKGWVLGYNENHFTIGLATTGGNKDGDGVMTYLAGETRPEKGRLYQVAATYDGQTLALYVNGKLETTSTEQSGEVLYPEEFQLAVAGYRDSNEDMPHHGRIRSIRVWNLCARPELIAHEFEHGQALAAAQPESSPGPSAGFAFLIPPYLQFATTDGMTVMCETTEAADAIVRWGETEDCANSLPGTKGKTIHEQRITGLAADTQYFYRITATSNRGEKIESPVLTFQTAPAPGRPITFAIISDTQNNPEVAGKMAAHAWAQRPHFLLHPGDLVDAGGKKEQWTGQFFPSMKPLVERVAFFPVLGNHEQNAAHYYNYMSLPDPEYHYTFVYGDAQFFMIDTNKQVGPDTEQYQWLQRELGKSEARWKFACHHHPIYSSDENDYGNLWKTNKGTRGDTNARQLARLYDQYGIDIVWNGHIHSYERTWPVKDGKPAESGQGTIYMVTGGGGGPLETAGPVRPFFQNTVKHGHHYCMARINGNRLEFSAYDLEGRLFDTMTIEKKPK